MPINQFAFETKDINLLIRLEATHILGEKESVPWRILYCY